MLERAGNVAQPIQAFVERPFEQKEVRADPGGTIPANGA